MKYYKFVLFGVALATAVSLVSCGSGQSQLSSGGAPTEGGHPANGNATVADSPCIDQAMGLPLVVPADMTEAIVSFARAARNCGSSEKDLVAYARKNQAKMRW